MSMTRRGFAASLSATALSLAVASCSSSGGSGGGTKVNFGYIADYNGASLLAIANKLGLWEKHGVSVTLQTFVNGPVQIQALGSGDLDYGYIGPGAMWLPASGKAKIVAINTLAYADRVIGQPGTTSMADLRGKKVGVPEGTSGEMVLNLALKQAGMTMKDIQKVPMDPSTVVSAFASGQIEGAGIWYPLIDTIKEKVPDVEEVASTRDLGDQSFPTVFVAGNKVPDKTNTKVIKVLQEANDWRAEHPEESIAEAAGLIEIPEEKVASDAKNVETMPTADLVAKTEDGTVGEWLDGLSDFFVRTGQLKKAPDPSTFYTGDLYTKAAAK